MPDSKKSLSPVSKISALAWMAALNIGREMGIIKKIGDGVKIMGDGELTKKLTVLATKFTATAKEKIEAAGGKAEVI